MTEKPKDIQERISMALRELGFDPENEEPDGSDLQHKVTQKAIDRLLFLLRDGRSINVSSSGEVTVIK